jgi:hypothetical protein
LGGHRQPRAKSISEKVDIDAKWLTGSGTANRLLVEIARTVDIQITTSTRLEFMGIKASILQSFYLVSSELFVLGRVAAGFFQGTLGTPLPRRLARFVVCTGCFVPYGFNAMPRDFRAFDDFFAEFLEAFDCRRRRSTKRPDTRQFRFFDKAAGVGAIGWIIASVIVRRLREWLKRIYGQELRSSRIICPRP